MKEGLGIYISVHCDFQNTLEEMLRNQSVNNEQIQRVLLEESSLDFKKAMKLFQWRLPKKCKGFNT